MRLPLRALNLLCAVSAAVGVTTGSASMARAEGPSPAPPPGGGSGAAPSAQAPSTDEPSPDDVARALAAAQHAADVAEVLADGVPDAATEAALARLGALAQLESLAVLSPYANHRRERVRLEAHRAAARIPGAAADALLERGLSDGAASVRGECARLLADRNARASVPALLRAFDRGVLPAGEAVGRLGDGPALAAFHRFLGTKPLTAVLAGYRRALERRDVPAATKAEIITRLSEVASPEIKRFFEGFASKPPPGLSSKHAADMRAAARRIAARPKAGPPKGAP